MAGAVLGCAVLVALYFRRGGSELQGGGAANASGSGETTFAPEEAREEKRDAEFGENSGAVLDASTERASDNTEQQVHATRAQTDGKVRPHPDSPERDALLYSRAKMERAKEAARLGDVATLRHILRESPAPTSNEPFADWVRAYEVILTCLTDNDATSRDRARRFVEEERGSTMRRDVRRYCGL